MSDVIMDDDEFTHEDAWRLEKAKLTKNGAYSTQTSTMSRDSMDTSVYNLDSNELTVTRSLTNKQYETLMFTPKNKNHVDILITRGRYKSRRAASSKLREKYEIAESKKRCQFQKSTVFFVCVFIGLALMLGVMVHVLVSGIKKDVPGISTSVSDNRNHTIIDFISDNKAYVPNAKVINALGKGSKVLHKLLGTGYGPGAVDDNSTATTVT